MRMYPKKKSRFAVYGVVVPSFLIILGVGLSISPGKAEAASCGVSTVTHSNVVNTTNSVEMNGQLIDIASDCTPTDADFYFNSDTGTPGGTIVYSIWSDVSNKPGALLLTGDSVSFATGAPLNDTFTAASCLTAGNYFLAYKVTHSGGGYADFMGTNSGTNQLFYSDDSGSTWTALANANAYADINGTVASCSGGGGGGGGGTASSTPLNGLGGLFLVSYGWYFVFFMEMLLLFIPIYAFVYYLWWIFGGYNG